MTSINHAFVVKLEESIEALVGDDSTLKAASDAFLAWRVKERKKKRAREKKAGANSDPIIPGIDYLNILGDKEALLKILKSNPDCLLEFLRGPKKAQKKKMATNNKKKSPRQ